MTNEESGEFDAAKLIADAERIIGREDRQDYQLEPTRFADCFRGSAEEFSAVLAHAALVESAGRYEQRNAQAKANQQVFKRLSGRATLAIFIATVTAAGLTGYAASLSPGVFSARDPIALLLGILALASGGYAAMLLSQINGGRYLTRWMSSRAAAETERLGYFNRLVALVTTSHAAHPYILLLALELFRRYQLALQQVYYTERARDHRESMDKSVKLGSIAAGMLALCSGGAGILGYFEPGLLPLASVGLIGSALATVASRREEINQDERNAERYDRTADVLSHLRERHTDVQRAVARGNTSVLVDYVNAVHEQLSLEHRQWLAQAEAIESALAKLTQSLKDATSQQPAA